jgi:hypothetical protein
VGLCGLPAELDVELAVGAQVQGQGQVECCRLFRGLSLGCLGLFLYDLRADCAVSDPSCFSDAVGGVSHSGPPCRYN